MNTQLAKVLYEFAAGPASEPWDTWDTIKEDHRKFYLDMADYVDVHYNSAPAKVIQIHSLIGKYLIWHKTGAPDFYYKFEDCVDGQYSLRGINTHTKAFYKNCIIIQIKQLDTAHMR